MAKPKRLGMGRGRSRAPMERAKAARETQPVGGDGMVGRFRDVNRGDLSGEPIGMSLFQAGVRAPIVAKKPVTTVEQRGAGRWIA